MMYHNRTLHIQALDLSHTASTAQARWYLVLIASSLMKRFKKIREGKQSFSKLQDDGDKKKDLQERMSCSSTPRYVINAKDENQPRPVTG